MYSSLQKSFFLYNLLPELILYVYRNPVFLLIVICKSHASLLTTFRYLEKNPGCNKNRLLTVKNSWEGIVCLKPQYYLIFFFKKFHLVILNSIWECLLHCESMQFFLFDTQIFLTQQSCIPENSKKRKLKFVMNMTYHKTVKSKIFLYNYFNFQ